MTSEQLKAMQAIQDAYLEMKLAEEVETLEEEQVSADRKMDKNGKKIPARRIVDKDSKDYEKTDESVESLDELSRKGLSNYISAAKDDNKERSAGIKLAQKKKWGDPKFGTTSAKVPANEEVELDEAFDPEKFKAAMDKTKVKVNMDSRADREAAGKEKSDASRAARADSRKKAADADKERLANLKKIKNLLIKKRLIKVVDILE